MDIEISKILLDLSKTVKEIKNISFYSAIELDEVVLIITRHQDVPILSKNEVLDKINQFVHKEVRFLERTKDPKKLVESLIHPIPVLNVSTLYLPPFSDKEYKIEISKKHENKLPIPEEVVVQTVTSVLETEAYIEYL